MKILANDGISPAGEAAVKNYGFEISTEFVAQDQLIDTINKEGYSALLVRSATKVRKDIIDNCPGLKLIGRGGVGMDNIDVEYARSKGIHVVNTPASSSLSVAEMVMAQAFAFSRFLHKSYADMPSKGASEFKALKKAYAKGTELRGKTMGIIGMGRIGQALASYALGCGMDVVFYDRSRSSAEITLNIANHGDVTVSLNKSDLNTVLSSSDYLSLHVPAQANGNAILGESEFAQMKNSAILINTARGNSIDANALVNALDSNSLRGAIMDVFENEPTPNPALLVHPKIATTPHTGAATLEAQERIGLELADLLNEKLTVNA
jgi:D-3-phosphoglycerate dehydrogenase